MPKIYERRITKDMSLENYEAFYNNSSNASPLNLSYPQLHEILHLHGYTLGRNHRRKDKILEALSGIEHLLNPKSSTLNEALSPCNRCLNLDEVKADIAALNWQDKFPVESLESISFTATNTTNADVQGMDNGSCRTKKRQRTRVRLVNERKVFDAIHPTKPRSKKKSVDNGSCQTKKRQRTRVRLVNERKVFDAIHPTKPRSKRKSVKRKRLFDINNDNVGRGCACSS